MIIFSWVLVLVGEYFRTPCGVFIRSPAPQELLLVESQKGIFIGMALVFVNV